MAKVFVVALDGAAEVAKIIAGDFAIQLSGWTEMAVAAVAAVTVLYLVVKLLLWLPVIKHLVAAGMAFCLTEAVLSTIELMGFGFGLTAEQIFGAAVAAAGICFVLSIRRARRERQSLTWTREYNADNESVVDTGSDDHHKVIELWVEMPKLAKRVRTLEEKVERTDRLLGAQHATLPEPGLFGDAPDDIPEDVGDASK